MSQAIGKNIPFFYQFQSSCGARTAFSGPGLSVNKTGPDWCFIGLDRIPKVNNSGGNSHAASKTISLFDRIFNRTHVVNAAPFVHFFGGIV